MTKLEKQLFDALQALFVLHLEATEGKPRNSKEDIEVYYKRIERKAKRAINKALEVKP